MSQQQATSWRPFSEEKNRQYQYVDEQGAVSCITVDEYRFEGVDIFCATSRQEREVRMIEYQAKPVLNLYFSLEGCCGAYHNHRNRNYPIKDGQHTVSFTPGFDGYYTIESPTIHNFGIVLSDSFFQRLFVNELEGLKGFWDRVQAGKLADMTQSAMPITAGQLSVIKDIKECSYAGHMKQLFYEAKIIELFLLQAQQAERLNGVKSFLAPPKEKDQLYAARDFLQEHMFEPITLLQVARSCGLNDFKLKKGFKELFGTTVFGYLTELKMDYGRQLLLDSSSTVYEVAYLLGYTDPYNFSKAFKKHFGYLPGKLRKDSY